MWGQAATSSSRVGTLPGSGPPSIIRMDDSGRRGDEHSIVLELLPGEPYAHAARSCLSAQ